MTLGAKETLLLVAFTIGLAVVEAWSHDPQGCRLCLHPLGLHEETEKLPDHPVPKVDGPTQPR